MNLLRAHWPKILVGIVGIVCLAALSGWVVYSTVPDARVRVLVWWGGVRETFFPPPAELPAPAPVAERPTIVFPTAPSSATPLVAASVAHTTTSVLTPTPAVTATPAPTTTPLPARIVLTGFKHEYQKFNNCGPASLSINLSYWGWQGSQKDAAAELKPVQDDKNVSPRELYEYLLTQGFDAYIRVNGDVDLLKRFIAAGYPVLVEKGFDCPAGMGGRCSGWFGHYSVFTGYDDAKQEFITQDSFLGPNLTATYDEVTKNWRAFNFLFLVVFPADAEHDAEVTRLLGPTADLTQNYYDALARAQQEAFTLTERDSAFAWFNIGTNLAYLQDYAGAAKAYDEARRVGLPFRMLWYQFGPFRSYYYTARYSDVVELANFAIDNATAPGLEEAYYWRGQAEESQGFRDRAINDYRMALKYNPLMFPAQEALVRLGETP